jgi:hypothetical protein
MNCEEALVEMETISTTEIRGSAVALHSAHCLDCARVLQAITDADRLMIQERDEAYFTTPPDDIARRAVLLGQRHGIFAAVSGLSLVLLVASVWYAAAILANTTNNRRAAEMVYRPGEYETETFEVRCLSTKNVRQLLGPYLTMPGSELQVMEPPLRVFTVRTAPRALQSVREVLQRFDTPEHGNCRIPDATRTVAPRDESPASPPR